VYFSCLEALQNVAKYSSASRAVIRLARVDGELRFEVEDDGTGFDASTTSYGTGLQGIADRLDALGSRIDVRSAPGKRHNDRWCPPSVRNPGDPVASRDRGGLHDSALGPNRTKGTKAIEGLRPGRNDVHPGRMSEILRVRVDARTPTMTVAAAV
jgi:Histidine kinase-, DNA gyrase B-, and HSP90-like ATPase